MLIKIINKKIYKHINPIMLAISILLIIFIFFSMILVSYVYINNKINNSKEIYSNKNYIQHFNLFNVPNSEDENDKNNKNSEDTKSIKMSYELYDNIDAFLTIPILNLYSAPISEGTSQEVMEKYIGHFTNTSYNAGNIGLASHNRGIGATYFENVYKLKHGDYILYTYKNVTKRYVVDKIAVIDSYDWSYLENTNENRLTLITCINDKPEFRLCVQAVQT